MADKKASFFSLNATTKGVLKGLFIFFGTVFTARGLLTTYNYGGSTLKERVTAFGYGFVGAEV